MGIPDAVGNKIRMYRRLKRLSQEELAARIYKSKSVLSKYELGQSNLDVSTLCAIASALEISPAALLDIPEQKSCMSAPSRFGIFQNDTLYLIASIKNLKFWRGVLTLRGTPDGQTVIRLYSMLPSFSELDRCKAVYEGPLSSFSTNTAMLLSNLLEPADMTGIFVYARKGNYHICPGLLVQFAYRDNTPSVVKTILSDVPLREDASIEKALTISKDELTQFRRSNVISFPCFAQEEQIIDLK